MNIVNAEEVRLLLSGDKEVIHSERGASAYNRWNKDACPGSIRLIRELGVKNESSVYSDEGSEAHNWLTKVFIGDAALSDIPEENGMRDAVEKALLYIKSVVAQASYVNPGKPNFKTEDPMVWVEQTFTLDHIYPGLRGTADYVVYSGLKRELHVIDYKHGAGVLIEATTSQITYYALGAVTALDAIAGLPVDRVVKHVVQPRCAHPSGDFARVAVMDVMEVYDFALELEESAKLTEKPDASRRVGEWCRFCPAKPQCPELEKHAYEVAKVDFKSTRLVDFERLSRCLSAIPAMEAWIKGVRSFAYHKAVNGHEIPGFKLVPKRATRKWKDENEIAEILKKGGMDESDIFTSKLNSPAKILKGCSAEERQVLKEHVVSESTGFNLVQEAHVREAVSGEDLKNHALKRAQQDFQVVGKAMDLEMGEVKALPKGVLS
jgi:hypothetical protein